MANSPSPLTNTRNLPPTPFTGNALTRDLKVHTHAVTWKVIKLADMPNLILMKSYFVHKPIHLFPDFRQWAN